MDKNYEIMSEERNLETYIGPLTPKKYFAWLSAFVILGKCKDGINGQLQCMVSSEATEQKQKTKTTYNSNGFFV